MAHGTVITAKGKRMDFADLVRKSRKPISTGDMKDTVVRQQPPTKELRARGHLPSHAGVAKPVTTEPVPPAPEKAAAPAPQARQFDEKSLADYTEIKIDEAKHMKGKPDDALQSSNEALEEILKQQSKMGKK